MPGDTPNLDQKLDILIRLVAIGLVVGKSQQDQIRLLSVAGMRPSEIAELIGTTGNTVNVALSGLRKSRKLKLNLEGAKENA